MGNRIQTMASIIFALFFVAILAQMNTSVLKFGADMNGKVNNTLTVSENYELDAFDNTQVTGDTVISAIHNRETLCSNRPIEISINGYVITGNDDAAINSISPSRVYTATLMRNANDVVQTIDFVEN